MRVQLAESPLTCVASGAGQSLEDFDTLAAGGLTARRRLVGRGSRR